MRYNCAMQKLLKLGSESVDRASLPIPTEFLLICTSGFMQEGNCVFLKQLYDRRGNGTRSQFPDDVGYECFVNHFHVDEFSKYDNLTICMRLIDVLKEVWTAYARSAAEGLRVIISSDEDGGCVLRFHKIRPSENWLAADLNSYQMAILVQDIAGPEKAEGYS